MKQFSKDLGNVSLVPKGKWSREQEYEKLALVYNACDNLSYVAKINIPSGVDIENREYWQPMNATGYADNNFINLTAENENGTITAYESLEEAVATILPINRRAGATLSFYNLNSDRLDRQAEFELWQFNSTDLANWENRDYWNNVYYNWNVFVGWYVGADALKNHVKLPTVGQYAYVGSNLNDAVLYQCRTNGTWTNTGTKVRNYMSVVVSGNVTIGDNGNWFSDGKDTGIPATPAVDEQLDNIGVQLQQHAIEIDKLQKQDVSLKSNIDSNFETINNKVDEIKTDTDSKIDTADANLQKQITSNDNDIATLNIKHESLSKTVEGIAATGGASTATNVTYNKNNSGLNAENVQDAINELNASKVDNNIINISNYDFKYTLRDIFVDKLKPVTNRIVIELSDLFLSRVNNLIISANTGYKVGLLKYTKATDTYAVIVSFTDSINIAQYLSDKYFIIVKKVDESNIESSDLTSCISMEYEKSHYIHSFNNLYFVQGKYDDGVVLGYRRAAISKVLNYELSQYKKFIITANEGYKIRLIAYKGTTKSQVSVNSNLVDLKEYVDFDYFIIEITRIDGLIIYPNQLEDLVKLTLVDDNVDSNKVVHKAHTLHNILNSIDSIKVIDFYYGDFTVTDFNNDKSVLHTEIFNLDMSKYKSAIISPAKENTKIALCRKVGSNNSVIVAYTYSDIDIVKYSNYNDFFITVVKSDRTKITEEEFTTITPVIKLTPVISKVDSNRIDSCVYIGIDGNDSNNGTYDKPFKTLDKAFSISNQVVFKKGTYENISIDLSSYKDRPISIQGEIGGKTILMNRKILIDSPVSLYSNYNNVYSKAISEFSNSTTIYQHLVNDEDTKITENEINSYQRGAHYRCDCTKIKKLTIDSTHATLTSVLDYIESEAANNRFYYIYSDGILYFSKPKEISNENCICQPNSLCINAVGNKNINLSNLYFYYGAVSFINVTNANVEMCIAKYTSNWGCFYHNNSKNVKYIQCEAASNYYGSYGDGFNGDKTTKNDDDYESNIILIDCWAHDNNDDGYSTHYGCNAEIWGGLYEHNQKAGITPAQGTHCIAHNVLSRKNINGFYYILNPTDTDDGINGNMECFNCVAELNSNDGFLCSGVKDLTKNSVLCVNCISIKNANYGYQGNIRTINCKVNGNSVGDKTSDVIVQSLNDLK